MLSNTSKYAIRAMIYLALEADQKNKTGIKKISDELKIPAPFLAKILQVLAKHKLLASTKGPNGGFSLGKDPFSISLYDIVMVIDGQDIFEKCLISLRSCHEEQVPCPVHSAYEPIRKATMKLFQDQNIGDLAKDIKLQGRIFAL